MVIPIYQYSIAQKIIRVRVRRGEVGHRLGPRHPETWIPTLLSSDSC